jgi:hypothetical protein
MEVNKQLHTEAALPLYTLYTGLGKPQSQSRHHYESIFPLAGIKPIQPSTPALNNTEMEPSLHVRYKTITIKKTLVLSFKFCLGSSSIIYVKCSLKDTVMAANTTLQLSSPVHTSNNNKINIM